MNKEKQELSLTSKVFIIIPVILLLLSFASCNALLLSANTSEEEGNVAIIPLKGVIVTNGDNFVAQTTSDAMVQLLKRAQEDEEVKAVILEINSPGGSPVASDEIGQAVQKLRAANKTVVAWMREVGASGAYWVAVNTDHIIANDMTITGSIGVVGSYFGFEEFIDEHNISYRQFTAGSRKDLGSPFRAMTKEEERFMNEKLQSIHKYFIQEVATGRNMEYSEVDALATGEFFLGFEALEVGLIDELGGLDEAIAYIEEQEQITAQTFTLTTQKSFLEQLTTIQVNIGTPLPQAGVQMRT